MLDPRSLVGACRRSYRRAVHFAVLGPLEVCRDDLSPVLVPGAKERVLLAVLLAAVPAAVADDRLQDAVWDGAPPPTARKSLQAHVVRLRSALEPDRPRGSSGRYVARRGAGYALSVERAAVDALRAADLAARGRAQLAGGETELAVAELTAARALWRGQPYADWPYAPFAERERRRLAELRVGVDTGLLEAQLALGRHADVLPELEALIAQDPLREGWWRLLMLALYRDGRQADALAAGRRVRALLADELGADPGPGLRAMETAILAHDPGLELGSRGPDGPVRERADAVRGRTSPGGTSPGGTSPGGTSPGGSSPGGSSPGGSSPGGTSPGGTSPGGTSTAVQGGTFPGAAPGEPFPGASPRGAAESAAAWPDPSPAGVTRPRPVPGGTTPPDRPSPDRLRAARTWGWPRTNRTTQRCSTAGLGWSPGSWRGWPTPTSWSCPDRAAPASPPSPGPASSRRSPAGRCAVAPGGSRSCSPPGGVRWTPSPT